MSHIAMVLGIKIMHDREAKKTQLAPVWQTLPSCQVVQVSPTSPVPQTAATERHCRINTAVDSRYTYTTGTT